MARITITFGNSLAGQASTPAQIDSNCTVRDFLRTQNVDAANANIQVNRRSADLSATLNDGDYLTVTPKAVKGA